jgi:hypothetical protein
MLAIMALVVTVGAAGAAAQTAPAASPDAAPAASPAAAPAPAVSPEVAKDIHKLLEVTHAADMSKAAISQTIAQFKKAMPDVPEDFWTRLEAKVDLEINGLLDQLVPVYAKYLSPEDVKGLISFYESPLGRRFVAAQPKISGEAMTAAMAWGRDIGVKIMAEAQAEQAKPAAKPAAGPAPDATSATPAAPEK